jgi:hypothetical protein
MVIGRIWSGALAEGRIDCFSNDFAAALASEAWLVHRHSGEGGNLRTRSQGGSA